MPSRPSGPLTGHAVLAERMRTAIWALEDGIRDDFSAPIRRAALQESAALAAAATAPCPDRLGALAEEHLARLDELVCLSARRAAARCSRIADHLARCEEVATQPVATRERAGTALALSRRLSQAAADDSPWVDE